MVKKHLLLTTVFALLILAAMISTASAQRTYHLNQEWVKVWINPNGTIDIFYNISITLDSGLSIRYVFVGQPNQYFTIGAAADQYGHVLDAFDASVGSEYRVQVNLSAPLGIGQSVWFTLTTNVNHMIFEDTENTSRVDLLFIPTWWEEASVDDIRVLFVLPYGVNQSNVQTSLDWINAWYENDTFLIFWQGYNLSPNEKFPVGVSFPKQYVQYYDVHPSGIIAFLQKYGVVLFIFGFIIFIIGAVFVAIRKRPYLLPSVSMETLGVRRGLTAVEASYMLDMQPTKMVTEILYSLLQKRAVWVESTNPSLKLKIMQQFEDKVGPAEMPLRYYEIDFLEAIKEDGMLDEEKLAKTIMTLRDTVEDKMRGYCRRDTIDYYRKIVDKAWQQVEQAGTPELASKAYDEHLLWLLLDPNNRLRTETVFRDRAFEPSPFWLWYWYSYQHYHPNPTYKPNVEVPAQSVKPPTILGSDFANNIATAVEKTSNNIVTNLEKFANAIIPMSATAKASTEPARHDANCVCACASCACVCACVSCACACASGGVG